MGIRERLSAISDHHPLLKANLFYLFYKSTVYSLPQYLGLYYKHTLLLSPHQVAVLLSVRPFLLLFGSPFLGSIADKTNKFRELLIVSLVTFLVTYVMVPFVEPVEGFNCQEHLDGMHSLFTNMSTLKSHITRSSQVHVHTDDYYLGKLMEDLYYTWPFDMYEYKHTDSITFRVFITLLIITILGEFFASPAESFADLYTLQVLGRESRKFGWQQIPGLFGWFITALGFGIAMDRRLNVRNDFCHVGHIVSYSPYLYTFYGLTSVAIIIACFFKYRKNSLSHTRNDCSCNFLRAIPPLMSTPAYAAYTMAVVFCGFGCGVKLIFVYHYITELGGPDRLLLIVLVVHFLSGLVALAISPKLLDRFGAANLIAAGLLCIGVTFVVYSLIKNAWFILIIEPFQGICYQLSWVAIVTYAGAPPNIGAALQGTIHGLHRGLGLALGYFIVSVLILKYGYAALFLSLGLVYFLVFGLFIFVTYAFPVEQTIAELYETQYSLLQRNSSADEDDELEMKVGKGGNVDYDNDTLDRSFLAGN